MATDITKLTKDTLAKGGVLVVLYFDLHGNTKELLQNLGTGFVDRMLKEPGVIFALGEIEEPIEERGIHSTSIEIKVLTTSFLALMNICALYSPFSLEILKPSEIHLSIENAHELLISVGSTTMDYKKYIIQNISKPEDVAKYKQAMQNKADVGKRLLEKKGKVE
ncbi:MAG: hypothetical protein Q7S22_08705 [Candidatus Micrarchaeota archaeon]|nr:hypothetical protein [Candidatus Micrarchaeota archaeon]